MSSRKPGRPSRYTQAIGDEIATRIAEGESLRSICEDAHMPTKSTVLLWVVDGKHEAFSDQYARAREAQGHSLADNMLDLHRELRTGDLDPQQAKVIQDGLKWQAERLARKTYGQRQEIEHRGQINRVSTEPLELTAEAWAKQFGATKHAAGTHN